jgi:MAP/microtubule affinity-regulating kinase
MIDQYNKWRLEYEANKTEDTPPAKQMFDIKQFNIGLKVGAGSYAVVKRCVHKATGHVLALKTYEKRNLQMEEASTSLHREIYMLANLRHENVMRLYEVVDCRTQVHLVMELCGGRNLYHHIKRRPQQRLPEKEAAFVYRQIISAMAYMHSINVVHRDMKLDNILIDDNDHDKIKLIDFGFATACGPDEKLGVQCGTTHYMCPDLCKRSPVNFQAADVWACGVILFILIVGKMPFFA